jgi:UDP-2,3-diacylglucosamine pyrophosphatase LpxH
MREKLVSVTGGSVVILMGLISVFFGHWVLPFWHSIILVVSGLAWLLLGFVKNLKTVRRVNILFSILIVFFTFLDFAVPSFGVYFIGTGNQIYTIHKFISLGFGIALFALSFPVPKNVPRNLAIVITTLLVLPSCGAVFKKSYMPPLKNYLVRSWPDTSFTVLSDIHVYDKTLGTSGKAFEEYLTNDRKDLVSSIDLLNLALDSSAKDSSKFVIVSGDLTKDGELASHQLVARKLLDFEKATGKQVYVICGNHDLNNPDAMKFDGDSKTPVDTIQKSDFKKIYADFGYDKAIMADPDSPSYVAEPVDGLWMLFIDSTDADDNFKKGYPEVNGKLSQERFAWIEKVLSKANLEKKPVIVVTHHGIIEHYEDQDKYFGDYMVDDFDEIGKLLASYGVRTVFTGHYHSTDVTLKEFDGQKLYDIETGSLVSYPNAFRKVSIVDSAMKVSTECIASLPGKPDYSSVSLALTKEGIATVGKRVMGDISILGLKMNDYEIETISNQVADAVMAHYAGDEDESGFEILYKNLSLAGRIVVGNRGLMVKSLWNDLWPSDKKLTIDLESGEVVEEVYGLAQ